MSEVLPVRTVEQISLSDLAFDPDNPRLPTAVDRSDEAEVLRWMINDEGLLELMGSIGAQGYFQGEPILLAPPAGQDSGPPYIVVEGNRRLAAVKLLVNPELAPARRQSVERLAEEAVVRPAQLPAVLFSTRDEILDYLGYRHVTGVKEWDPLAKARYIEQLIRRARDRGEVLTSQQLARRIGSRSDYVDRLLDGLRVYTRISDNGFYGLDGVNEDAIQFSVLTTALGYQNIASFVGLRDEEGSAGELRDEPLRDLTDWMFHRRESGTTVLGESRNLSDLAAVVKVPRAVAALKDGVSLSDATLLTDEPLKAFRRAVEQATDKVKLARSLTHRITKPSEADITDLVDLTNMARELLGLMRNKVENIDPTL